MSFEATNRISSTNSLSHQEQQQQSAQNEHQSIVNSLNLQHTTMSPLSLIQNVSNIETNVMFDSNSHTATSPLQSTHKNREQNPLVEFLMPGIYLTKDFISLKEDNLRSKGFSHIIIIDKHIQELYYPNQQPDIFKICLKNTEKTKNIHGTVNDNSSSLNAFDYYCSPTAKSHLKFGKEFEVIELNFGEKSYLTTVLPNCYRAVKFINKALQASGTILVIDCNGGEQKCLTIIVAYLMYKHNINFR